MALALAVSSAFCAVSTPVLAQPAPSGPANPPAASKPSKPRGVAETGVAPVIVLPANSAIRIVPADAATASRPVNGPPDAERAIQPAAVQPANAPVGTPPSATRPREAPAATTSAAATRPREAPPATTTAAATRPREAPAATTTAAPTRPREAPANATPADGARPATAAATPGRGPATPAAAIAAIEREPSAEAAEVINWVVASRDNGDRPFIVIDKVSAQLFVFDPRTRMRRQAPVLIGIAKGDHSMPGIGDLELSRIPVSERTTPAGRFLAQFGPALDHEDVLWVDEPNAVSLHAVVTSNPRERRLARLQSATPDDNRITFGCINVDHEFYSKFIEPLYREGGGLVYILPESRPLREVFAGLPGDAPSARPAAKPSKPAKILASSDR